LDKSSAENFLVSLKATIANQGIEQLLTWNTSLMAQV
jgi:hypothetical protein